MALVTAGEPSPTNTPELGRAMRRYGRRLLITIGIDRYQSYPALQRAKTDTAKTSALLEAQGFASIGRLMDEEATRSNILDLLHRDVVAKIGKNDLVVVFFAGHGASLGNLGYIVPHDGTDDLSSSAVSLIDLKASVLRWPNRHTFFVVDACFSGAMFTRLPKPESNPIAFWESRAEDRLVEIITAGDRDEPAFEDNEGGLFATALLAGLAGAADSNHDSVITGEELARFSRTAVSLASRGAQNPQWGTVEGAGTLPFWDSRRVPRGPPRVTRSLSVPELSTDLARVHDFIDAGEYVGAERLLRRLLLERPAAELNLILAELYLEQDELSNGRQAEGELKVAEGAKLNADAQRALIELRARIQRARRASF